MYNSIVSVCIFFDKDDKIYLVRSSKKDNNFPLVSSVYGTRLEDLEISGKSKNNLSDLIFDTLKYSFIQREIKINDNLYLAYAILLDEVLNTFKISNSDLLLFDSKKTVIIYFTDISSIEETIIKKISETVFNTSINIVDVIKYLGIKNFLILLLLFQITDFIVTEKILKTFLDKINENFIQLLIE